MATSTTAGPIPAKPKKVLSLARREARTAYLFISPWIIGFLVFTLGPMVASLIFSITDYSIVRSPSFVGFSNFLEMFTGDYRFWHSLKVTIKYAIFAIPIGLIIGLLLALLLNTKVPGISVWRTVYYTPSVVSGVAVAILWAYLFNPQVTVDHGIVSIILFPPHQDLIRIIRSDRVAVISHILSFAGHHAQ